MFNEYFWWDLKNSKPNHTNPLYRHISLIDRKNNEYFIGEFVYASTFKIDIHENKYFNQVTIKKNPAPYKRISTINESMYPFIKIPDSLYKQKKLTKDKEESYIKKNQEKKMLNDLEDSISLNFYKKLKSEYE